LAPKECRIYITPEDEIQIKIDDLRKKRKSKETSHTQEIVDIYAAKDKEMEERRRKFISSESNIY